MTPRPTLGQVLRQVLAQPPAALRLSPHHWKTLRALAACRTGALGGQVFYCPHCRREHVVAHSCRNRHCPQCQGAQAVDWLDRQAANLLPVPYFHLVFTLPHALNELIRQNRAVLFKLLFDAASQTVLQFGTERLKAQLGLTTVLHTWSQTLLDHYHLHCIVTGGGLARDKSRWVASAPHYLFPVRALSRMFRGKYLAGLRALYARGKLEFHGQFQARSAPGPFAALLGAAAQPEWVVYAKRPFAGPHQVLAYLSRYTHRVALSPRRLLASDERSVTFAYKDYADDSRHKTMTLDTVEFVRRFCLHVLPERFVKIRHYGLLGNRQKQTRLARVRELLGSASNPGTEKTEQLPEVPRLSDLGVAPRCPFCGQSGLVRIGEVPPPQVRFDSSSQGPQNFRRTNLAQRAARGVQGSCCRVPPKTGVSRANRRADRGTSRRQALSPPTAALA